MSNIPHSLASEIDITSIDFNIVTQEEKEQIFNQFIGSIEIDVDWVNQDQRKYSDVDQVTWAVWLMLWWENFMNWEEAFHLLRTKQYNAFYESDWCTDKSYYQKIVAEKDFWMKNDIWDFYRWAEQSWWEVLRDKMSGAYYEGNNINNLIKFLQANEIASLPWDKMPGYIKGKKGVKIKIESILEDGEIEQMNTLKRRIDFFKRYWKELYKAIIQHLNENNSNVEKYYAQCMGQMHTTLNIKNKFSQEQAKGAVWIENTQSDSWNKGIEKWWKGLKVTWVVDDISLLTDPNIIKLLNSEILDDLRKLENHLKFDDKEFLDELAPEVRWLLQWFKTLVWRLF